MTIIEKLCDVLNDVEKLFFANNKSYELVEIIERLKDIRTELVDLCPICKQRLSFWGEIENFKINNQPKNLVTCSNKACTYSKIYIHSSYNPTKSQQA